MWAKVTLFRHASVLTEMNTLEEIHWYANLIWRNDVLTDEQKYDKIFSEQVSRKVFSQLNLDYCDPDTTYKEDVDAFMNAFNSKMRVFKDVS